MSENITIAKEIYEELIGYKRIVEIEYERPLSKELLKKLEKAKRNINAGKGITLHSKSKLKEYFEAM
ncbi:hypothetical protein HYT57_00860 [Candidatus Woesearchaeota archaeon]|nr:hypothetical protein [Candidatus Woesearchaeota archaeon]